MVTTKNCFRSAFKYFFYFFTFNQQWHRSRASVLYAANPESNPQQGHKIEKLHLVQYLTKHILCVCSRALVNVPG